MNILLTLACNLDCEYCFARARRSAMTRQEMTMAEVETVVSRLDPDRDMVRLMGGEPTLHDQYPRILKHLLDGGFAVTVFTNGILPTLRETAPYLPEQILLNLNDWSSYSQAQREGIIRNLAALGDRVGLGYTVLNPDFDLGQHRRLILDYGLRPVIRIGLAQPVVGGANCYLPDADLDLAHRAVVRWARRLAADRIRLNFDCGFMRCKFSNADLGNLIRSRTALRFTCGPAVDVGPGLRVWRCMAFSAEPGLTWQEYLEGEQSGGAFPRRDELDWDNCRNCGQRTSGACAGGCLARSVVAEEAPQSG
ncbi:MAG: radical SAM protein [Chloroflexota bacterium]|nr:radical SAM protein [Chloroflexota bacterium]